MINKGTAYLLWLLFFMGLGGVQRFYAGQVTLGVVYLFTWGIFGIGQLVDLLLIPEMVDERNKYLSARGGNQFAVQPNVVININGQALSDQLQPQQLSPGAIASTADPQTNVIRILKLAQSKGGSISLPDAVIELGKPASEVRNILTSICSDELMEATNDESTGAIIYRLL
jgi:TM2 domain-containing membrane protein YozV